MGVDPATGETVVADYGRYGPYLKRGTETRSLESEEQLLEVTLKQALELLAKPKERRRQGAAAGPLREIAARAAADSCVLEVCEPIVYVPPDFHRFAPGALSGEAGRAAYQDDCPRCGRCA